MLTEQRQEEILRLLNQKGSVTLQELKEYFHASESTIRRDLNALDKRGALTKVFGGAVRPEGRVILREEQVSQRQELYRKRKTGSADMRLLLWSRKISSIWTPVPLQEL